MQPRSRRLTSRPFDGIAPQVRAVQRDLRKASAYGRFSRQAVPKLAALLPTLVSGFSRTDFGRISSEEPSPRTHKLTQDRPSAYVCFGWKADLGTDDVRRRQTSIPATDAINGKRRARVEHGLNIAFTVEVEIGSVEHK